MLESIKKFLFGPLPDPDLNMMYHQPEAPPSRAGLFKKNQRAKGDIWVDTSDARNRTHWWDGDKWTLITNSLNNE